MSSSHPEIRCGPVVLRLPVPDDAEQLFELASDPALSRYLQWSAHESVDDSRSYIDDTHALWSRRVAFLPSIYRADTGELVGSIGLSGLDWNHRRAEVGTWIGIPWQGKGYNRPAKAAIFTFGFELLNLHRLELVARSDNQLSLDALVRLPGIQREGTLHHRLWQDDEPHDAELYAITRDRWRVDEWPAVTHSPGLL